MEELLQTSYMIGKAISAITFPGMYRIYDFHSEEAPPLKNTRKFTFFGMESEDEDEDEASPVDPSRYEHMFHLRIGEDSVYLEDPCGQNEAGWTPLHTCCMSFQMISAAEKLIDEMERRGESLDQKTANGPGNFNQGWTALHMACAYGVEPIVKRLIAAGADVNTVNNFGYTPLLEACHRGFVNIVRFLIEAGADLSYIPPEDLSSKSPFVNSPAQAALAESARSGFHRIAELLLESGADKDKANDIGWTALHEACFYNRVDTCRALLDAGACVTGRTRSGAMPYHLAGLGQLRTLLEEIGGDEAVPKEDDRVDMVAVLKELTLPDVGCEWDSDEDQEDGATDDDEEQVEAMALRAELAELEGALSDLKSDFSGRITDGGQLRLAPSPSPSGKGGEATSHSSPGDKASQAELLHSGAMLGDLPSLENTPNKTENASPDHGRTSKGLHHVLKTDGASDGSFPSLSPESREKMLHQRRGGNKMMKKKKKKQQQLVSAEGGADQIPAEFMCELTQRLMTDPVETPYGNIYERGAILNWLQQQGQICPMTGTPLVAEDLTPAIKLKGRVQQWLVAKSSNNAAGGAGGAREDMDLHTPAVAASKNDRGAPGTATAVIGTLGGSPAKPENDDDLYDF
jgi:ankyrin repeat protein